MSNVASILMYSYVSYVTRIYDLQIIHILWKILLQKAWDHSLKHARLMICSRWQTEQKIRFNWIQRSINCRLNAWHGSNCFMKFRIFKNCNLTSDIYRLIFLVLFTVPTYFSNLVYQFLITIWSVITERNKNINVFIV